jgi:hypothetical protein
LRKNELFKSFFERFPGNIHDPELVWESGKLVQLSFYRIVPRLKATPRHGGAGKSFLFIGFHSLTMLKDSENRRKMLKFR